MKWFRNHCGRREDASLLAAGVLSGSERIAAERHLVECAECRAHYDEARRLSAQLAGWERNFASIETTQAMRTRWEKAVVEAATPSTAASTSSGRGFIKIVWRELIWPSRYAWCGFGALWLAMLAINARLPDQQAIVNSSSPGEILRAWDEQQRMFAEWNRPGVVVVAAPGYIPGPRSQRDQDWAVI